MIHIVFEASNVEVLSKAFELDPSMQGNIIEIKDDFAVGPIVDIYDTYGYQLRRDWWKELLEFTPYKEQMDLVNDKLTVFNLLKRLDGVSDSEESALTISEEIHEDNVETEKLQLDQETPKRLEAVPENKEIVTITQKETKSTKKVSRGYKKESKKSKKASREEMASTPTDQEDVWIWMGQNQHDVCGYYWLMPQLKNYQGRIHVLYLNNLPFINEKGSIFYPTHLFQIQPKEFLKAKKLSRPITLSEFESDPDEWKKLCSESAIVRILEGGKKIASKEDSFYDKDLLSVVTPTFQKVSKILFTSLGKMKIQTGDVFLAWRIRKLIEEGKVEVQGDWSKGWKEVDVKLLSDNSETN